MIIFCIFEKNFSMKFELISDFSPTGDQPDAIKQLTEGINEGRKFQTLLGVTGSGKTFSIANVIEKVQKPTLILSHNKTLAAQLYSEFKQFFPQNAVEYFVSYYDYFHPEAYLPATDMYIEKELLINDELEKLRISTTTALLSGRRDVIVVSSVSCLFGIGNPQDFHENIISIHRKQKFARNKFLRHLVYSLYSRNEVNFERGNFRVKGDTVDIFLAYGDIAYRIVFWDDEIEEIYSFEPESAKIIEEFENVTIYPANIFITSQERIHKAMYKIQDDLTQQVAEFQKKGKTLEAKRLEDRVNYDLEMLRELGHCQGIENYSRYFDGRLPGTRPFCLLDYFPKDFLTIIDESHVTLPQIHAMFGGDFSRKTTLVEYGFRLSAAFDNRPLKFEEFENLLNQTIYLSATPGDYELQKCEGIIVEQLIRPTGLLDPPISVRPTLNQIDNLVSEIHSCVQRDERILVLTLTKRMAEELSAYLSKIGIRCEYIHSEVETLQRIEIMAGLRKGLFDVLVGINLLREGLDLPEVSLVAILDADKEGFLRSHRSLTQTAGRAARHLNGKVIMYADKITDSMQKTINETERRREKQLLYNQINNIIPRAIEKSLRTSLKNPFSKSEKTDSQKFTSESVVHISKDPVIRKMSAKELLKLIESTKEKMKITAKEQDFLEAARLRDEMFELERFVKEKF